MNTQAQSHNIYANTVKFLRIYWFKPGDFEVSCPLSCAQPDPGPTGGNSSKTSYPRTPQSSASCVYPFTDCHLLAKSQERRVSCFNCFNEQEALGAEIPCLSHPIVDIGLLTGTANRIPCCLALLFEDGKNELCGQHPILGVRGAGDQHPVQ